MRSLTFETKSHHSQNSHAGHLILIHWSTQIRHVEDPFMYLIEGTRGPFLESPGNLIFKSKYKELERGSWLANYSILFH